MHVNTGEPAQAEVHRLEPPQAELHRLKLPRPNWTEAS